MPTAPLSTLQIATITPTVVQQINYNTKEGRLKASNKGALPIL